MGSTMPDAAGAGAPLCSRWQYVCPAAQASMSPPVVDHHPPNRCQQCRTFHRAPPDQQPTRLPFPRAADVNPELLTTFYPTLSAIMLDVMLRQAEADEAAEGGKPLALGEPGAGWPLCAHAWRPGSGLAQLDHASFFQQPATADGTCQARSLAYECLPAGTLPVFFVTHALLLSCA